MLRDTTDRAEPLPSRPTREFVVTSKGPWSRMWLSLLALFLVLTSAVGVSAQQLAAPQAAQDAPIAAIGEAQGAEGAALPVAPPADPAPAPPKPAPTYEAPTDQPALSGTELTLPKPPPSFNNYDRGWIHFAYPPSIRERVQPLIAEADQVRAELSERLGREVLTDVHVHIARTPGEMTTLAPEGAPYPKYASGVAYSEIGLVLLTLAPQEPNAVHDLAEVFRHELAHVALHDAVEGAPVPRWFNEGFAVHASGESSLARLQTLWTATLASNLVALQQLDRAFRAGSGRTEIAYAQSADLVRFLIRKQDRERFVALIERIRKGQPFEAAVSDAYAVDLAGLEYDWREEVAKRYSFWPVFFSGTVVWLGALGLFVFGYQRRRKRSKQTLERWTQEEALEDGRRALSRPSSPPGRVHIVFPTQQPPELPAMRPPVPSDTDVPKVEHEGQWHTLH